MNANWRCLLGGFLGGILLMTFCIHPPKDSSDWASWVQAIGSIGAILVAVWVLYQQNKESIRREDKEVKQIILSLRDEVSILKKEFSLRNMDILMRDSEGPYLMRNPISEGVFMVYTSTASQIGKIKNDKLRKQIVATYARAYGFIQSLKLNNSIVKEYDDMCVEAARDKATYEPLLKDKLQQLTDYGPLLRKSYPPLKKDISDLSLMIDKEIPSNDQT